MAEQEKENIEQSQDQDGELDIAVQGILGKLDDSQDEAPTKIEQPKGQDEKVEDGEQLEPEYEITEDEFKELTEELGYNEEDLDTFKREDVDNILETKTKKPEKAEPEEQEIIITEKIAEKYGGMFKSFIGKSLKDVAEALKQNNAYVTKLSTELKQYKEQTTQNEKTKIDELDKLIKNPPEGMAEEDYLKKIDELVELKATLKARALQPDPDTAKKEAEFYEELQSQIPSEMKATEIAEKWWASLSPQEQEIIKTTGNPVSTRREIRNYALNLQRDKEIEKLKEDLKKKEDTKEKDAKILAAKKVTDALKKSKGQPVHGSHYNIVSSKSRPKYGEETDITVQRILEKLDQEG